MAFPDVTTTLDDGIRGSYPQPMYNGGGLATTWDTVVLAGSAVWTVSAARRIGDGGTAGGEALTAATYGPDAICYVHCASAMSLTTSFYLALWIAATNSTDGNTFPGGVHGYALILGLSGTNEWTIRRYGPSGTTTLTGPVTQAVGAGDSFGVRMVGTTIDAWYKASAGSWTQLLSTTDTTYNRIGRFAFESAGNTSPIDGIFGGTITGGGGTTDVMTLAAGSVARGTSPTVIVFGNAYGALGRGNAASAIAAANIAGALGRGFAATDFAVDLSTIGRAVARGNAATAVATAAIRGAIARGSAPVALAQAGFAGALGRGIVVTGAYSPVANRGAIARGFVTGNFVQSIDLPVTLGMETHTTSIGIEGLTRTIGVEDHSTTIGIESHTTTIGIDG